MTEKRFNLISDNNLQLYDFIEDTGMAIHTTKVVDLLNELAEENEQLKSTLYYLLNVIQNKCPKYYPKCKEIVRSCFENDSTNSRNDFNNTENDGDVE